MITKKDDYSPYGDSGGYNNEGLFNGGSSDESKRRGSGSPSFG